MHEHRGPSTGARQKGTGAAGTPIPWDCPACLTSSTINYKQRWIGIFKLPNPDDRLMVQWRWKTKKAKVERGTYTVRFGANSVNIFRSLVNEMKALDLANTVNIGTALLCNSTITELKAIHWLLINKDGEVFHPLFWNGTKAHLVQISRRSIQ